MNRYHCAVLLALAFLSGCSPYLGGTTRDPSYYGQGPGAMRLPPLVAFQDSSGPLAYRASVPEPRALREVHGEACQSAVILPLGLVWAAFKSGNPALATAYISSGWGEGGYAQAASRALMDSPGGRLVNVRADMQTKIILGVWRQQCVRITALAVPAS